MGTPSFLTGLAYGYLKRDLAFELAAEMGTDIAVDLGRRNTVVYVRGHGIVLCEPSVMAVDPRTGCIHAFSFEAEEMLVRLPEATIFPVRPPKGGVIADLDVSEAILRHFIEKVHENREVHPRVVVCVPSVLTEEQTRAVEAACLSAGARDAWLIADPIAALIGAGLPVDEPAGSMVVDIGGGTSTVSVIARGGILLSHTIRSGGDELDERLREETGISCHLPESPLTCVALGAGRWLEASPAPQAPRVDLKMMWRRYVGSQ